LERAEEIARRRKAGESGGDAALLQVLDKEEDEQAERRRAILLKAKEVDADSDSEDERETKSEARRSDADNSSAENEDDSDDSEDETSALLAELAKIKAERAAEQARQASLAQSEQEQLRQEEVAMGNPLLNLENAFGSSPRSRVGDGSETPMSVHSDMTTDTRGFAVKRRWDDDVVFKNQAKGVEEEKKRRGQGFVNDLLRSEFHKRFMSKYVR